MTKYNSTAYYSLIILSLLALGGCTAPLVEVSKAPHLKQARYGHSVVNDGKKIYVIAGANKSGLLDDIEIFDPITNSIQVLSKKLIPRRYFSAVWDGVNSIYILGGVSIQNKKFRFEKRVEVFNTITHEVSFARSMPAPTRVNSAVLLDGKIIVLGGASPKNGKLVATALVDIYDIKNSSWQRAADMPTAKTTRAFVRNNYVYVVGGYDSVTALDVFERFDPKLNQWFSLPSLPVKISAHSLSLVKNKLFIFGDYKNLTSTYCYDFDSGVWQNIDLNYKASRHNATTTLGERTFVIGGNSDTKGPFLDYIQVFTL